MRPHLFSRTPHNHLAQCKVVEQFILSKFLLNLAGCCNILLNRNFAAEIVGRMQDSQQERQVFLSSIAIRNASDDIQVFNEMFVSCNEPAKSQPASQVAYEPAKSPIFFPRWLRKQTHGSGPCLQAPILRESHHQKAHASPSATSSTQTQTSRRRSTVIDPPIIRATGNRKTAPPSDSP